MLNLFPEKTIPYFIVTPPYTHKSAGVCALHLLCHALNMKGQKAYLIFSELNGRIPVNPALHTPWWTPELSELYPEAIYVYPDIVRGNPYQAKKIVRWHLGHVGAHGYGTEFPEATWQWSYSTRIARQANPSLENVMCLPVSDPKIFYDNGSTRDGTCYYAKKCEEIWGAKISIPKGAVRLEGTQEEIAEVLRRSEKCFVFEDSSIILEAHMCGCPVEYVKSEKFTHVHTEEDWMDFNPELLPMTSPWRTSDKLQEIFERQFDRFIQETQKS